MRFLQADAKRLQQIVSEVPYRELQVFTRFIHDVAPGPIMISQLNSIKKAALVEYIVRILSATKHVENIYKKLVSTEFSSYLYAKLLWEGAIDTEDVDPKYGYTFLKKGGNSYEVTETQQEGLFIFVTRFTAEESFYTSAMDQLAIKEPMRTLLKFVFAVPEDFDLVEVNSIAETEFTYSNEYEVFNFVNVISEMLQNNLVAFGKTNEKPLSKTLSILKSSSNIQEFYNEKKLDTLATDMLTRSFSYYYWTAKKFKNKELETLKEFVKEKFNDNYYFFITRILATHLKKIRYDHYYLSERNLFDVVRVIIEDFPTDGWVGMNNILKYCSYRGYRVDLEGKYKTDAYYMEANLNGDIFHLSAETHYNMIFLEPILKGAFFYLGALGLVELKYNAPLSPYVVTLKDKEYISPWDSLEYVKLTALGKYVFDLSNVYEHKNIVKKTTNLKFDEYKPIVTIDTNDTISKAKLEQFCDKYEENRYILSHAKIFRDCKTKKMLELKIDSFYKNIEKNPPQVFRDFFDEIQENINSLKKETQQVVIRLNNNKKLLNLFMNNKKLQELVIKAQGYRIIVLKTDLARLTKIVKENGFFVEF